MVCAKMVILTENIKLSYLFSLNILLNSGRHQMLSKLASLSNKGIKFIDSPSIFRDNNVISAIPSYFKNAESPIICYKYNKPIRNTILNFNKLVSDLDIKTSSLDS